MGYMIKGVLRNLAEFTRKQLWQSLFFDKVAGLKPVLMTIFQTDAFKNFAKFTGKHLWWSLFVIRLPASKPSNLLKRDSNSVVFL